MTKIDKNDLENINFLKKELKLKNIQSIKIKKGNYEIEISSNENIRDQKKQQISLQDGSLLKTEQKIKQNNETFKEFFVQDGTIEYFNDNLVVLSASAIDVKDLSKDFINNLSNETQSKIEKKDITDHDRYMLSHKLDVLKELGT